MRIHIPVQRVIAIGDLGDDGTLFHMKPEPHEHARVSFREALGAYCDAVDAGRLLLTIEEQAND